MYKGQSIQVILPALNEAGKIGRAVQRIPRPLVDRVLVVDDGSTEGTGAEAETAGATVIRHDRNCGVGAAIRSGIERAQQDEIALTGIMAGDDQDDPNELVRLAEAIVDRGCEFVQGSRYLPQGKRLNQPMSRTVMTIGYSAVFSIVAWHRITDATNGFKLFRTEICRDWPLAQPWLDRYELEPYLLPQAIRRSCRVCEVPATKYHRPDRSVG